MPSRLFTWLLILLILAAPPAWSAQTAPATARTVLVINSYHPGFTWTDNLMQGIIKTLKASHPEIELQIEYMDAKRFNSAPVQTQFSLLLKAKTTTNRYPVVITSDNLALQLALKLRPSLFPKAAIVFCGLNGPPENALGQERNLTGVTETWDPAGTLRAIERLQPAVTEIVVLHDYTESGLGTLKNLDAVQGDFSSRFRFRDLAPRPVAEIFKELARLPDSAAVLLLGFNADSQGQVFDSAATGPLFAQKSRVPVYTMDQTRFSGGVVGGSLLTGEHQGELAAAMAGRILNGESADALAVIREPSAILAFDYQALKRFGLRLEDLPPGSLVVNRPLSLYEQYRYQIWALAALIMSLIVALLALGYITISRQRMYAERLAAAEALRASEAKYRKIFEGATEGIYQATPAGRYLSVNPAYARMFAYASPQEMIESITDIGHQIYVNSSDREALLRQLELSDKMEGYEAQVYRRDGSTFWIRCNIHTVRDDNGRLLFYEGQNEDITARKQAEEEKQVLQSQLIQAHKLESIGRLAGGVAHDFNNLLSVILGYTELLLSECADGNANLQEALNEIWNAGERAKDLTRQLLTFARKQATRPKVVDLNQTVVGMLKMLERLIGENIELNWQPGQPLWHIKIDPSQLDQILANLVVNARDAIDQSGAITIRTANIETDEAYCAGVLECRPGEYVQMLVSDTGSGMDQATLTNIFEPFFTTKAEGRGTGLGLATVYGIVKQNGGFLEVESTPGRGTTFKINLPRCAEEKAAAMADRPPASNNHASANILLVEDDEAVLKLGKVMLESLGYRVVTATTCGHAIELACEQNLDLIVTDLIMPDMNGVSLSEKLKGLRPELKCLFMSGYAPDAIASQIDEHAALHCIQKPFSLSDLAEKVRSALAN